MSVNSAEFKHGWPVVFAGLCGNALGVGAILYYSVSSFIPSLEQEFGWTRTEIGFAVSCQILGWIMAMPVVGKLCDQFGARAVILPSIPLLSLALLSLSYIQDNLVILYLVFIFASFLGAGTLGLTYITAVSRWFEKNRGLAYGVTLSGTGLSAFALPIFLHVVISELGWRGAWQCLSLIVLLQLPIAYWGIRSRDSVHNHRLNQSATVDGVDFSIVIRSRQFWFMALSFMTVSLLAGILINIIPLLIEKGIAASRAASLAATIGIGLLFARISIGFLVDRLPARFVAVFAFLVAALGCQLLLVSDPAYAGIGAFALGFTAGAELDLLAFMTARYFGLKNHGSIYGAALSFFYAGAIFAPILIGELYRLGGGYSLSLQVITLACILACLLIMLVGPYPEERSAEVFYKTI